MKKLKFKLYYSLLIFSVTICGCKEKKQPQKQEIGEYVYLDQYKCIHVRQNCIKLMVSNDGERQNYMVDRISLNEINKLYQTCSWCINDEIYKDLQAIIEKNKNGDSLIIGW